jgi:hypothetical protein
MDTTTNLDYHSSEGDTVVAPYQYSFDDDGDISLNLSTEGSYYEQFMTTASDNQGGCDMNDISSGNPFPCRARQDYDYSVSEDGYPTPGIMTDYDGISPPTLPLTMLTEDVETDNYYLSPSSLQNQELSSPSRDWDSSNTAQQPMANVNLSLNSPNRARELLPRPAAEAHRSSQMSERHQEGGTKKSPCGLPYVLPTEFLTVTFSAQI